MLIYWSKFVDHLNVTHHESFDLAFDVLKASHVVWQVENDCVI